MNKLGEFIHKVLQCCFTAHTAKTLGISKEDLGLIKQNAKKARMSQSDYVTHCCLGRQIVVIEGLKELAKELRAIGNNLNQLTTQANMKQITVSE